MSGRSVAFSAITSWPAGSGAAAAGNTGPPIGGGVGPDPGTSGRSDGRVGTPWSLWADSVRVMAAGGYSTAWPVLQELAAGGDPELSGLASATLASGLRQVGRHAEAVPLDDAAIASAGVGVLDGLTGRAADAIGLGRPEETPEYLRRAALLLPDLPDQRLRGAMRIGWVRAEAQLLLGEPAVAAAGEALARARELRSPRHLLKSRLIHAVARQATGDSAASRELRGVFGAADRLGIPTLLWPAALALGAELPAAQRDRAVAAAGFIRGHLPPGESRAWLASVADLIGDPDRG